MEWVAVTYNELKWLPICFSYIMALLLQFASSSYTNGLIPTICGSLDSHLKHPPYVVIS